MINIKLDMWLFWFLFSLLICFNSYSQSTDQLDSLLGFKDFQLLSDISEYYDEYTVVKRYRGSDGKEVYSIDGGVEKVNIGSYKINLIEVYTINSKIYNIKIELDDLSIGLYRKAFGSPTESEESERDLSRSATNVYKWRGRKVILTLKQVYVAPNSPMEVFGETYYKIDYSLVERDSIIDANKTRNHSALLPFSAGHSDTVKGYNKEASCWFYTQEIKLLNTNWVAGEELTLGDQSNFFGRHSVFKIQVAKNYNRSIIILERYLRNNEAKYVGESSFEGDLVILLSNGFEIKCVDRNLRGNQIDDDQSRLVFSVYYLTSKEYEMFSKNDITSLVFKYNDGLKGTETQVFDNIGKSFQCAIEGIEDYINRN